MPLLLRIPIPLATKGGAGGAVSQDGEPKPRKSTASRSIAWSLDAPAKVNLFLEILGKRKDGFHALETVMTPLGLADRLTFADLPESDAIRLRIRGPMANATGGDPIPTDERNLVVRALNRMKQHTGERRGANILLEKHVPSEAGLGGGSSDAAAALLLANHAWDLRIPLNELRNIAADVGSDVPYFLQRSTAVCRGRGELVEPTLAPSGRPCVIAKPSIGLSTAEVYRRFAKQRALHNQPRKATGLLTALSDGNWRSVAQQQFNRLEEIALQLSEPVRQTKRLLQQAGLVDWMMTGSGSAFFAFAPNMLVAQRVVARARQLGLAWAVATHTS